jgi:UDP-glucose 4-epimerase
MQGQRVLITGGAGAVGSNLADLVVRAGARDVIVLDNFVRGRRENLAWAVANGPVQVVDGDIRDRELVRRLTRGVDVVFHQAALRITQCAEEPRLALEVTRQQSSLPAAAGECSTQSRWPTSSSQLNY